jgi:alkylated DNA repair protein alkB homolog 6
VATISLGSHTVVNYYRYVSQGDGSKGVDPSTKSSTRGSIDPDPIFTLLLEPRSLVVTRSKLYTNHLHGIDATTKDIFHLDQTNEVNDSALAESGNGICVPATKVVNRELIEQETLRKLLNDGGELCRLKRISLTFRDVEKVFNPRFY